MFHHILKLIWKKKRSNFLMMLEIFFSFLILFAVWSLSIYSWRNYSTPSGINIDNTWVVYLDFNTDSDSAKAINTNLIRHQLGSFPQVQAASFSSQNVPYGFSSMNWDKYYQKKSAVTDVLMVDPSYPEVFGMKMKSGRWFQFTDTVGNVEPVVLTQHLATELFGNEDPVGKLLDASDDNPVREKVVGVVEFYKHKSSFQENSNTAFQPVGRGDVTLSLKMAPGADAELEARLVKALQQTGKDWTIEVQHYDNMRSTQDRIVLIPLLILFLICGFLVFNVALGLFGVLFQSISRRKSEIGVRRAMGATKQQILGYFMTETVVIASFGVVLGLFFTIQIPLLHVFDVATDIYAWAMLLATVSILLITALCAWYPSRQAAAIYPASVLHEE